MNLAIEQAKILYHAHGLNLAQDIGYFMEYGVVVNTPTRLLLGRPISLEAPDSWVHTTNLIPNCWLVHLAIGRGAVRWFFQQMPFQLPYVAWRRGFKKDERLHVYRIEQLQRRIS